MGWDWLEDIAKLVGMVLSVILVIFCLSFFIFGGIVTYIFTH